MKVKKLIALLSELSEVEKEREVKVSTLSDIDMHNQIISETDDSKYKNLIFLINDKNDIRVIKYRKNNR